MFTLNDASGLRLVWASADALPSGGWPADAVPNQQKQLMLVPTVLCRCREPAKLCTDVIIDSTKKDLTKTLPMCRLPPQLTTCWSRAAMQLLHPKYQERRTASKPQMDTAFICIGARCNCSGSWVVCLQHKIHTAVVLVTNSSMLARVINAPEEQSAEQPANAVDLFAVGSPEPAWNENVSADEGPERAVTTCSWEHN